MSQFVDYAAIAEQDVSTEDSAGAEQSASGLVIPLVVPSEDIAGLLASYDATNQYSPSAADSRALARLILDSIKKKAEE